MADQSIGLLVSLHAGFVSEHCTQYQLPGGWLLVNTSHGDATKASINPEYSLRAVVNARSGRYTITELDLDSYLIPKRPTMITPNLLHQSGRGIHRLHEITVRLPLLAPITRYAPITSAT